MATLEDRIRKLEDRAELHDLATAYFQATDDDDYAWLGKCFASDATFAASGFPDSAGRAAITDFLKSARSGMGQTVHTPSYVRLTFDGDDEASGMVAAHLELGIGDTTYFAAVRYFDRYRREDGHWRIARREMRAVHVGPWADVGNSLSSTHNIRWPGSEPQISDFPRKDPQIGKLEAFMAWENSADSNNQMGERNVEHKT